MAAPQTAGGVHVRPLAPAPIANGQPTPPSENTGSEQTMPYTCVTCAKRKVKCDKLFPLCSTCRKGGHECLYEAPPPRKRKRRHVDDVQEKLEQYERLLQSHGISPSETADRSSISSPNVPSAPGTSLPDPPSAFYEAPIRDGKLYARSGKSRYIDSSLWKRLAEVSEEHFDPSEDDEEAESDGHSGKYDATLADPISASLLGPAYPHCSLLDKHPTYDHAIKLWKVYCQNVDPLLKITHAPTGLLIVQRAASNPSSASKTTECLLFVVYHFAVLSLNDAECQEMFGQPRERLLSHYHDAARQGLINASFLRTTDMAVLQAFALFLISTRTRTDPHTFWILTGVCVRIAQRMGLHRDGEQLGMKPFDVQLRRRLYWQLLPMDGLAAHLCGASITGPSGGFDTKSPLNLNDSDLWPDMTETPVERKGATDMIFCMVRAEVGKFHQAMKPFTGDDGRIWQAKDETVVEQIEQKIDELENNMESKWLRYVDFVVPTHCLAQAMARTALCAGRFRLRLPFVASGRDAAEKKAKKSSLFDLALRVVDYDVAANSNSSITRFRWHLRSFFQWEALIWILECLRQNDDFIEAASAWSKIQELYNCHPEWLTQKRTLHIALGKLTLRAWDAQPIEYRMRDGEPMFIQTIRRNLAKTETPKTEPPMPSYNAFDPPRTDEYVPDMTYMPGPLPSNGVDFSLINGFNPDTMDWMYWDQLIKDQQDAFSLNSSTGMIPYE